LNTETIEWLFENAGPIIRWRLIRDFGVPVSEAEAEATKRAILESAEVGRWLDNLGGTNVHGSKDTDAENAMAKLIEYGLCAGMAEFDAKMLPYVERMVAGKQGIDGQSFVSLMAGPFLIAAGYTKHPAVRAYFRHRLAILYEMASKRDYDLYITPEVKNRVPSAWRDKPVYKPEYYADRVVRLPSCYDLYALAHWPAESSDEGRQIEEIVAYLADPRFQATPGGYLWDVEKRRCYAAGRVFLACLNENRKVLFLELMARFKSCYEQPWFRDTFTDLESYRTDRGTYCFPSEYLVERRNSYYIYNGAHMGLGENRRRRQWREIESTFRMANIKRLMGVDHP
jgi:hypothetical protein